MKINYYYQPVPTLVVKQPKRPRLYKPGTRIIFVNGVSSCQRISLVS